MIHNYFLDFYTKSKFYLTNISQSISYYTYKIKEKLNFNYSNVNTKENDDLTKLTIYEEEQKKESHSILEDDDIENIHINQLS